jgi:hypothetical protein
MVTVIAKVVAVFNYYFFGQILRHRNIMNILVIEGVVGKHQGYSVFA